MTAEPNTTTYSDVLLTDAIERYPVIDADGNWPDEDDWTETFDLALAASEIWSEKAASLAANFDFDADGAAFTKSQQVAHATQQARRWHSSALPWLLRRCTRATRSGIVYTLDCKPE